MQSRYYLLRNNKETGPYAIDELLLQQLTSTDLVWVEGEGNIWCHPYELEELTTTYSINRSKLKKEQQPVKPAPPPAVRNSSNNGYALPKKDLEQRAEEIRRSVLEQAAEKKQSHSVSWQTEAAATPYYLKDERFNVVYHKKQFKFPVATLSAAAVMILFILGAWFGKDIWMQNQASMNAIERPLVSGESLDVSLQQHQSEDQSSAMAPIIADSIKVSDTVISQKAPASIKAASLSRQNKVQPAVAQELVQNSELPPVKNDVELKHNPVEQKEQKEVIEKPEIKVAAREKKDTVVNQLKIESEDGEEKKNGLGQVLKGIFKKKKKPAEDEKETDNK